MQIFVRSSRTSAYLVDESCSLGMLKEHVAAREGVPSCSQRFVHSGRELQDDERLLSSFGIEAGSSLQLLLRLRGGKGGFGALLRGQGRDGNITTNYDACRDLQGRRLRHQKAERQLEEWKGQAKERELEVIALKHIKEKAKEERREERERVNETEVAQKHRDAVEKVTQAVQEAIASTSVAAGPSKRKAETINGGGAGGAAGASAGVSASAKAPAQKKSKMLDALVGGGDSDDDSDSE